MKKTKIFFAAVLAVVLAFACLAFTACGDNTFDIDTTKQASDADIDAYSEKLESAMSETDKDTGLPAAVFGQSYKTTLNASVAVGYSVLNVSTSFSMGTELEGVVNVAKESSAKLSGKMNTSITESGKTDTADAKAEITVVSNTVYVLVQEGDDTEKYKLDLSSLTAGLFEVNRAVVESAATTTTVSTIVDEITEKLGEIGIVVDPKIYIDDNVMKVMLNEDSYFGMALESDKLTAVDVVLKNFDLKTLVNQSLASYAGPAMSFDKFAVDFELKLRSTSAQTVTAPSDASSYTDFGTIL